MKSSDHLPLYGIGPFYAGTVLVLTAAGCIWGNLISLGRIPRLRIPLLITGILLILYGLSLWVRAVILARLDDGINIQKAAADAAAFLIRTEDKRRIRRCCFRSAGRGNCDQPHLQQVQHGVDCERMLFRLCQIFA